MNKKEFLSRLRIALCSLPEEERENAVKYYQEYFDEAGPEREREIIEELGSPEAVAQGILQDYADNNPQWASIHYHTPSPAVEEAKKRKMPVWAIVLVCLLLSPLLLPLGLIVLTIILGAFGVVFGLFIGCIGLMAAFAVTALVVLAAGLLLAFAGLGSLLASPAAALLCMGVGLLLIGFSILGIVAAVWLIVTCIPTVVRWIGNLCRLPFRKGGAQS
ncbi:DUF1700 domain-containing protein [Angelakisella massiliensis]|uniref:DUF1700 domain-containing protein n=1 Tax=Angelakisella massiliensis TaxID=1871018 RepID=UPI0008F83DC8|nr:DUF1700 domain-containing protein [Angelakisella massiliensis]